VSGFIVLRFLLHHLSILFAVTAFLIWHKFYFTKFYCLLYQMVQKSKAHCFCQNYVHYWGYHFVN